MYVSRLCIRQIPLLNGEGLTRKSDLLLGILPAVCLWTWTIASTSLWVFSLPDFPTDGGTFSLDFLKISLSLSQYIYDIYMYVCVYIHTPMSSISLRDPDYYKHVRGALVSHWTLISQHFQACTHTDRGALVAKESP